MDSLLFRIDGAAQTKRVKLEKLHQPTLALVAQLTAVRNSLAELQGRLDDDL
jgi:hypothetical protein